VSVTEFLTFNFMSIKVLHVISGLSPESGGTTRVVSNLTNTLAEDTLLKVTLLSQALVGTLVPPLFPESKVQRSVAKTQNRISLSLAFPLRQQLKSAIHTDKPNIIHSHGLWHPLSYWRSQLSWEHHIPLVIHPHGMLEPWALNYHKFKKQIALWLYQRRDLEQAKVLFATAQQEAESIRQFGLRQPIAITPNGVHFPKFESKSTAFDPSTPRTVLFLSRIHPKKGLINLIQAWSQVQPSNWRLLIAGPDENNHLAEVQAQINQHRLNQIVEFVGSVEGEDKAQLYRQADLFILPTFSENFGVVVAEALSYGVPVMTTTGTPWSDLEDYQCGWWTAPTVEGIADALKEATSLAPQELQAMGERGREYVQRYDWNTIAQDTLAVYRWILNQGPKPDCVILD
jgi:glycosyltransferase involved in cell wall biosynthesis